MVRLSDQVIVDQTDVTAYRLKWETDEEFRDEVSEARLAFNKSINNTTTTYAMDFDGTTERIDCGDVADLEGDLTVEFWMNSFDIATQRQNPIHKKYWGEFSFTLELNGTLSYFHGDNVNSANYWHYNIGSAGDFEPFKWYHIMLVRDNTGKTVKAYVNGSQVGTTGDYSADEDPAATTDTLYVADGYTNNFNGRLADVRIYKRTLSAAEVTEHYARTYTDESDLIIHYDFSDQTGTDGATVTDESGNSNDGTLEGSPDWLEDIAIKGKVNLKQGAHIIIKRGEVGTDKGFIFRGYIDNVKKKGATTGVFCKDRLIELVWARINDSFDQNIDPSAGVGSAILEQMLSDNTNLDITTVATPADKLIEKFICKLTDVFTQGKRLAEIYDYQLYYDATDNEAKFEPKGYTSGITVNIGGASNNSSKIGDWDFDAEEVVNVLTVIADPNSAFETQSFDGTGAADQENVLTYTPAGVVEATVSGTKKTMGSSTSSETYHFEVDTLNKKILWNQSFDPGIDTANIVVSYKRVLPIPVTVRNETSIKKFANPTTGFNGEISATKTFSDIKTIDDAIQKGDAYLDKYANDFAFVRLRVPNEIDFERGQKIRVIDNQQNEDRELIITKVKRAFPYKGDIVEAGDREWRLAEWGEMTLDRIKRLEEKQIDNESLITEVRKAPQSYKITNATTVTQTAINDSYQFDNDVNDKRGMGTSLDKLTTSVASCSSSDCSLTNSATQSQVGGASMKCAGCANTTTITSTQSYGNISLYTGVNSGTPSKGTVGLWLYISDADDISAITLKLGSGASDYTLMTGGEYRTRYPPGTGYTETHTTGGFEDGWNYLLFDLDGGTETGTPDWTACDYTQFVITAANTPDIYLDYFTTSRSNYIGQNGMGRRVTTRV